MIRFSIYCQQNFVLFFCLTVRWILYNKRILVWGKNCLQTTSWILSLKQSHEFILFHLTFCEEIWSFIFSNVSFPMLFFVLWGFWRPEILYCRHWECFLSNLMWNHLTFSFEYVFYRFLLPSMYQIKAKLCSFGGTICFNSLVGISFNQVM